MRKRTKVAAAIASAAALAVAAVGVAVATSDDDSEPPIRGGALARASQAAIGHVGSGRVTDTEVGDEESYYEVEVTRPDGSQVDVQLDRDFEVVDDEADRENDPGDEED